MTAWSVAHISFLLQLSSVDDVGKLPEYGTDFYVFYVFTYACEL